MFNAQAPLLPGTQAVDRFLFCSSYKMSEHKVLILLTGSSYLARYLRKLDCISLLFSLQLGSGEL